MENKEIDNNEFVNFEEVKAGDTALVAFKIFGKGIGKDDFAEITKKEELNKEYPKNWEDNQPFVYGTFAHTTDYSKESLKNALCFMKYAVIGGVYVENNN
jgi:hypothetical protein